jgi:hypothetical protein
MRTSTPAEGTGARDELLHNTEMARSVTQSQPSQTPRCPDGPEHTRRPA